MTVLNYYTCILTIVLLVSGNHLGANMIIVKGIKAGNDYEYTVHVHVDTIGIFY